MDLEFVKDEGYINDIWFYLIDIRRYWHFSSNITDDALTSSFCLVLFQKFREIIQQTHQQQAFRFIHKKLQREQDNPSEDQSLHHYIIMAQLVILHFLRRKRNALASDTTRHNINRSNDSHSFV